MPIRLDANYINDNGDKAPPVMIHRAILGSLERFIGIIIEEHGGNLPLWLSPVQAVILNIAESQNDYCNQIRNKLVKSSIRTEIDLRNEKISYKIREHSVKRIPYMIVVGDKEVENKKISIRTRDGDDMGIMDVDKFIKMVETLVKDYSNLLKTE